MPSSLTVTEIANLALSKLGPASGYLTDFDSDDSVEAEALRRVYNAVRDEVLESHPWRFAQRRANLAADVEVPAWGYAVSYGLPDDCLRVLAIEPGLQPFVVEGEKLLTDATAPLYIRYLARITDTSKFSPTFVAVLAARLADEICEVITKSATRRERLQLEYRAKLMLARKTDNVGRAPVAPPEGAWLDSRV